MINKLAPLCVILTQLFSSQLLITDGPYHAHEGDMWALLPGDSFSNKD